MSTGTVHQLAYCLDCDFENGEFRNHTARKAAYNHAKKTGHRVSVETGIITTYNQ